MAGKWRKLLEEESEHQWLAMGMFFLFVLFGAFALGATEHFVGDKVVANDTWHSGKVVIDIEYHDANESYTALVYSVQSGYALGTEYLEDGTGAVVYSEDGTDKGADVRFLKTMPNGEILFSVANNQLIGLKNHLMVAYEYPLDNGEFGILDVAEHEADGGTQRLLLTQEGTETSLRGVVGMMPTTAMSTSSGVQWHAVEAYEPGLWMALGSHISTAGADGSSPATPEHRPALGWIAWDGTSSTPVLRNVQMFSEGVLHSVASADNAVIVGGTKESLIVHSDNDVEVLKVGCAQVVEDSYGTVWFMPKQGALTVSTYDDAGLSTHVLSRPVPINVNVADAQGDFVHSHGTDVEGNPIQWDIDVTANGSIESGRGFLNLLYLLAGGILLAMMLWHAGEQLLGEG